MQCMFHPIKIISTSNAIKLFEKCKLKENAYSRKIISMHKHLSKNLQVSLHCLEYIFPDFLPKGSCKSCFRDYEPTGRLTTFITKDCTEDVEQS